MQRMDSFEFNKIAGAVLGTALVVFGLKELTGIIYHADAPEKPGMVIETAEAATDAGGASAEAPAETPIATLMAAADVDKGTKAMKPCLGCHTVDNGGGNKSGPNLWDIVGRNFAASDSFKYSASFTERASETWSYDALNAFLKKPKEYIPGTKMSFAGVKSEAKRADIIAYLRTLSDNPQPLPSE